MPADPQHPEKLKNNARKRPRGGVRAARRQERIAAILECAFALLEEGGLDAITTPELAKRTGSALGALYRFFPSKNAVIATMQRKAMQELLETLQNAVEQARSHTAKMGPRMQALVSLLSLGDALLLEPTTNPSRFRLVDELLSHPGAFFQEDEAEQIESALAPLLRLAYEAASAFNTSAKILVDDEEMQRFPYVLWASLHGVTHFAKRDRLVSHALQSRRVAGSQLRLLLLGLGANEAELKEAYALAAPKVLEF